MSTYIVYIFIISAQLDLLIMRENSNNIAAYRINELQMNY